MEPFETYKGFVDIVTMARETGVACVIVFRPNTAEQNAGEAESPDMIVSSVQDPYIIAALLGNYPVNRQE